MLFRSGPPGRRFGCSIFLTEQAKGRELWKAKGQASFRDYGRNMVCHYSVIWDGSFKDSNRFQYVLLECRQTNFEHLALLAEKYNAVHIACQFDIGGMRACPQSKLEELQLI